MARRTSAFVAALLLAAAPAASQQATPGQVAYVEGVRAFDAGEYATAAARMRTALASDGREATSRFRLRAQNAEDYFPHLWLGLSLEKLGDRSGALEALRESRAQGAVEARPALRRILASALARLTPPTPAPTATPAPLPTPAPPVPSPEPTPVPVADAVPTPRATPAPPAVATRGPAPSPASPPASPAAVRAGLRAFFRGDYAGAERILGPESGRSPVARLFLAWSLGGRYLLAEPRDAELLARARAGYSAALLDGAPKDGGRWVSPAILALFEEREPARRAAPAP